MSPEIRNMKCADAELCQLGIKKIRTEGIVHKPVVFQGKRRLINSGGVFYLMRGGVVLIEKLAEICPNK